MTVHSGCFPGRRGKHRSDLPPLILLKKVQVYHGSSRSFFYGWFYQRPFSEPGGITTLGSIYSSIQFFFMFMCTCISCQPKSYMKYTSDPLSLNNMICDCHRSLKFKRPSNWSYNSYHMRFLTACSRSPEYRCVTILIIQFTSCDLENFKVSIYSTTTKMIIIHLLGMVCLVL